MCHVVCARLSGRPEVVASLSRARLNDRRIRELHRLPIDLHERVRRRGASVAAITDVCQALALAPDLHIRTLVTRADARLDLRPERLVCELRLPVEDHL
jgi:hypothetical protein